ncbi:MAG: 3-dehydroquinate synthase [Firmicutes bacterium]|nr:3-dehydroquinate synthase [Bacillota bacterium]
MALPGHEYNIEIGAGLLSHLGSLVAPLGLGRRIMVVTNPTVARWYLTPVVDSLMAAGFAVRKAEVPDGEEYKSLAQAEVLYHEAVTAGLDRSDAILALGGGVIGDLAGFVAATYLRGIALLQVPTTLLAQIDSSIGGKVAVNLPAGKNLVGAFHQPRLVVTDPTTLRTLPERELRAGLVEMLKHGVLAADYFHWYERHLPALLACDEETLTEGIAGSCRIKAAVVLTDERERGGPRTLLNLGHTLGHALENVAGYGVWRHGEAVGLGLIVAGRLSRRLGFLDAEELERLEKTVAATLGPHLPRLRREQIDPLLAALFRDKKTLAGRLRFVLLGGIGQAFVAEGIEPSLVRAELEGLLETEVTP